MIRPFELFVGLRYTRAKRRNHFISFISMISMLGIVLGVAALITVLSVMNGFGKEFRDRILGVVSHITVTGAGSSLHDWQQVAQQVRGYRHVVGYAPYILGQALVSRGRNSTGVEVRGVVPSLEPHVSMFARKMVVGSLDALKPGRFGIVLGSDLAWQLDAVVGSHVNVIVPEGQITPAGFLPRFRQFTVVGIFDVGMYEYNSSLVLIDMQDAAALFRMGDRVTGLRLKLDNLDLAPEVASRIEQGLGPDYRAWDWTQKHANFFRALKMEKHVMFIIMLLIVAVAAFNVVSTLVMVVTEKQADIAILRTLGASPASIMGIFTIQGSIIGIVGTLLGAIAGIVLALNVAGIVHFIEQIFHTHFISPSVYQISELPSDLRWHDVAVITGASLFISLIATLYPALRAAKTQPAEALRYE